MSNTGTPARTCSLANAEPVFLVNVLLLRPSSIDVKRKYVKKVMREKKSMDNWRKVESSAVSAVELEQS